MISILQAVEILSGLALRVRRELAQALHQSGDRSRLAAQEAVVQGLEGGEVLRIRQELLELLTECADLLSQFRLRIGHG